MDVSLVFPLVFGLGDQRYRVRNSCYWVFVGFYLLVLLGGGGGIYKKTPCPCVLCNYSTYCACLNFWGCANNYIWRSGTLWFDHFKDPGLSERRAKKLSPFCNMCVFCLCVFFFSFCPPLPHFFVHIFHIAGPCAGCCIWIASDAAWFRKTRETGKRGVWERASDLRLEAAYAISDQAAGFSPKPHCKLGSRLLWGRGRDRFVYVHLHIHSLCGVTA